MSHSPTLFLLIGPPASGKSTWTAKFLADKSAAGELRNTTIVSSDDVLESWGREHGLSYSEAFARCDHKWVKSEVNRMFDEGVARGDDIIVDRTNMTAKIRRSFLSRVPRTTRKVGIIFDVPRDVLNERLDRRARETGKFIPQSAIDEMLRIYSPPTEQEFDELRKIEHRA